MEANLNIKKEENTNLSQQITQHEEQRCNYEDGLNEKNAKIIWLEDQLCSKKTEVNHL